MKLVASQAGGWMRALLFVVGFGVVAACAAADDFDRVRNAYRTMLTGGSLYDPSDATLSSVLSTSTADTYWTSMLRETNRASLWSDAAGKANTSVLTSTAKRLGAMALAYARVSNNKHYRNAALLADIADGLEWFYANWYNETIPASKSSGQGWGDAEYTVYNWWDFQIGTPAALIDAVVLLHDELQPELRTKLMGAIRHFMPGPVPGTGSATGANLMDLCKITAFRGVISRDAATVTDAIAKLSNPISSLFTTVTTGDGFYADGSFIQHTMHPYTGSYGLVLITGVCDFLAIFNEAPFAVTDESRINVHDWLKRSYAPLIYKGAMMDYVRGRAISRRTSSDHSAGRTTISAFMRAAQFAPPADAAAYKAAVKYWLAIDGTYASPTSGFGIYDYLLARDIMADANVASRGELTGHFGYASMDRVAHLRPGWGAGLAMHSTRTANFESINTENLRGWHTSAGMLYLYNSDLSHYSRNFWPTVDSQRLPGTTVEAGFTPAQNMRSGASRVGTVSDAKGEYGMAAMDLSPAKSSLRGRKAWFFSGRKIVCLGAGLSAGGTRKIETVVENRILTNTGAGAFTVDGAARLASVAAMPAAAETLTKVTHAHLAGSAADGTADIGYYFPGGATLAAVKERRTGAWRDINTSDSSSAGTTVRTNDFLTLWYDHGAAPSGAAYAYAVLPCAGAAAVAHYAASPDFEILENTATIQAVRDAEIRAVSAVFWSDAGGRVGSGEDLVGCDGPALVMVRREGGELHVSVADPTQQRTQPLVVELGRGARRVLAKSDSITVLQTSPTVRLSVAVAKKAGAGQTIRLESATTEPLSPLLNLSLRTEVAEGETFSLGYVVGGSGTTGGKRLLLRAVGPSLSDFGVTGVAADPRMSFFQGTKQTGGNDNWGGGAALTAEMSAVGAFPLKSGSLDAAAMLDAAESLNSVQVSAAGKGGAVLVEIYDATPSANFGVTTRRLANLSVLKRVGAMLTAGFVIGGEASKTVLIRAIGPTLAAAPYNVAGAAANPRLALFSGNVQIAGNDDWDGATALRTAFEKTQAFGLPTASKDAALLVTLKPGLYTVQVTGSGAAEGVALVELYEVP